MEEIFRAKGKFFRPCMSENIFILPSFLNKSLAVYRILGWESILLRIMKATPYLYSRVLRRLKPLRFLIVVFNLFLSLCKLVGSSLSPQHTDISGYWSIFIHLAQHLMSPYNMETCIFLGNFFLDDFPTCIFLCSLFLQLLY